MNRRRDARLLDLRQRWGLALAVIGTPIALLALALPAAWHAGSVAELPCWILPNLQIMPAPGNEACPIGARHRIARAQLAERVEIEDRAALRAVLQRAGSRIRLELLEGASRHWIDVPVYRSEAPARLARIAAASVGVALLLGIPLFLVWRSSSRAAVPLAAFYGCVSVVLIAVSSGQHSDGITRMALVALGVAPAAATHLSLVFPRERQLIRDVPELVRIPYAISALMLPVGWVALERDPLLWPAFVSLQVALTAAAWLVLILSCGHAVRESRSAIERARARLVFFAAILLPLVPTFALTRDASEPRQFAVAYLWSAAVAMPLPIAVAIGRYNLFDLESGVRHAIARLLYLAAAAFVVALLLGAALNAAAPDAPLREPAPLFLLSALCVGTVEILRSRTLGALEVLFNPQLQRLRRVREDFERRVSAEWEPDQIGRHLLHALRDGIAPRCACVLLAAPGRWQPLDAFGREAPAHAVVAEAQRMLGARALLHLAESSALQEQAASLVAAGVEAVVAIEASGERHALLLVGAPERRRPFTGLDLDFALALAGQAGLALQSARVTEELLVAERHAATGRIALGLAHDVGKDLGWMRRLVKRLPEQIGDPGRLVRDVSMLEELTDGLSGSIERFVREATSLPEAARSARRLEAILNDVTRRAERLHGAGRVQSKLEPDLRDLHVDASLERAIWNLLDNALHASPADAPIQLHVSREPDCVRILIEDRGCGIPEQTLSRVFEPGFTTRAQAGGSGVGLPVAQGIVESLGGSLDLDSSSCGTRARIRIPPPAEPAWPG